MVLSGLLLAACGQPGPLYMPKPPAKPVQKPGVPPELPPPSTPTTAPENP
ncbi:lipoprotein [Massilia sp. PAMC28688]